MTRHSLPSTKTRTKAPFLLSPSTRWEEKGSPAKLSSLHFLTKKGTPVPPSWGGGRRRTGAPTPLPPAQKLQNPRSRTPHHRRKRGKKRGGVQPPPWKEKESTIQHQSYGKKRQIPWGLTGLFNHPEKKFLLLGKTHTSHIFPGGGSSILLHHAFSFHYNPA